MLACAAASAREARCAGSSVRVVARSRKACSCGQPTRLRPAGRVFKLRRDVFVGPGEACARCQARRSGSSRASVTSAKARCISCRWWISAERYAAERTSGCRKRTWVPNSARPASTAGAAALVPIPTRAAARNTSAGSPVGSAAASSSSRRTWSGSASIPVGSYPRCCRERYGARQTKPAGAEPTVNRRGSSSRANGLPRVSATIRSRTRSSIGPGSTESSKARASVCRRPPTTSSGNATSSPLTTRDANTRPTDSAPRRRATNARTCAEARSSHRWSSTRHTSGPQSVPADRDHRRYRQRRVVCDDQHVPHWPDAAHRRWRAADLTYALARAALRQAPEGGDRCTTPQQTH